MHTTRRSATGIPWIMVETLDPSAEPTAVSGGDGGKDFVVLKRLVERALNSAHLGAYAPVGDVCARIVEARDRREPINAVFGQGSQKHVLFARPVFGPLQRVHGVQYWLGPLSQDPPEPRRAAGVVWDLPDRMVRLTVECTRMAGIPDAKFKPDLPLAMFWHSVSRFDHHEDVYGLLYNPRSRARLRTTGTIRHRTRQHDMYWQATLRARCDNEAIGAWGLLEDLTPVTSGTPKATLAHTAFREYLRAQQTYLGVIHIPDGSVVQWLTDPPPWIDCTRSPDQVFPPEDRARLAKAVAPDEGVVRAINRNHGYTPTKIILMPCDGRKNGRFAIGHFSVSTHISVDGKCSHAGKDSI